ncbi:MAG: 1-acyl-sn-glycerol-3-phosphate acyltransferase [Desulfovibrionaceae bacterium]|nr:1-acyl-sn-glycerol-3-phosphate acyltransferase [Desulfovibrionaceae bacterium]
MNTHPYAGNYRTPSPASRLFPSLRFYARLLALLYQAGKQAAAGVYSADDWILSSEAVGHALEAVGADIRIDGFDHVRSLNTPCVFVANHMSTLETFVLPGIIQPVRDVTFVVKNSLLKYPFLGPVLRSREPIVVGRANPREDLASVLDGGQRHLDAGRSVIIFPQGTRSHTVDERQFSSLGIKLARKAGVPVMPLALKSDAWGTGFLVKDIGFIRPRLPIRFRFGSPVPVTGNGREEHAAVVSFIRKTFDAWRSEDDQF